MAHVNINKEERGNRMYIIQFIRGFCMALADSVPGPVELWHFCLDFMISLLIPLMI